MSALEPESDTTEEGSPWLDRAAAAGFFSDAVLQAARAPITLPVVVTAIAVVPDGDDNSLPIVTASSIQPPPKSVPGASVVSALSSGGGVADTLGPTVGVDTIPPRFPSPPDVLLHRRLTTDGGASPNPGTGAPGDVSGCGMVCLAPPASGRFRSPAEAIDEYDGVTEWAEPYWCGRFSTNNTAEWWGVLAAVQRAGQEGKFGLTVLMDSQLIVRQYNQSCVVNNHRMGVVALSASRNIPCCLTN